MANPMLMRALDEVRRFLMPSRGIIMWSGTAADIPTGWALCDGTGGTPDLTDRFILGAGKTSQPGATGGAATATPSVTAGNAKTGLSLATAAPGGTAGNAGTGIGIWNAALNIWTGAAGTGIGIQGTTLDGNTLPNHPHSVWGVTNTTRQGYCQNVHTGLVGRYQDDARERGWVGVGHDGQYLVGAQGASWGHAHGVSDPGHAHAVGSSEHSHGITDNGHTHVVTTAAHGHTVTDGGHTHTLTAQALSTLPPYYALCFIMKL